MHAIEHTYISLLADVSLLTGFSEIRGSYEGLQWCLKEAPKLEKYIVACVEHDREIDINEVPIWLRRLALGSMKDPILMRYLRQLLLFCYKAYIQHDKQTTEAAYRQFLDTNRVVREFSNGLAKASPKLLNDVRIHVQSVLYKGRWKRLSPSHGPGSSTTPKERWSKWYSQIESIYPYSDYYCLYFNKDHCAELVDEPSDEHISAKLIAVPKDSRGPRLICVHPAEAIWIQQGLRRELERVITLERRHPGPWPRGHIQFDDQSVNGKIALLSSKSRKFATLDMKEASDRISESLLQVLFGRYYKYFGCCRAQTIILSDESLKGNIRTDMNAYAPMGNATVFPVQSLVFWAICCASLQRHGFHQPNAVFVFGDDIIVPSECAEFVIDDLESFGLLVNRTKSFWRGHFRESCGVDAFNGVNVTPTRWKCSLDAEHLVDLLSLSDLGMRLRISGYEEAAICVYSMLRDKLSRRYGKALFITNNVNHGGIAEYHKSASYAFRDAYWHRGIQWYVTPVWRLEQVSPKTTLAGWNQVLESVCSIERTGHSSIPDRSVSRRTRLARGWIQVA